MRYQNGSADPPQLLGVPLKETMATKFKPFEKSTKDKEVKGLKEGSKKEMAMDKKQMGKMPAKKKGY